MSRPDLTGYDVNERAENPPVVKYALTTAFAVFLLRCWGYRKRGRLAADSYVLESRILVHSTFFASLLVFFLWKDKRGNAIAKRKMDMVRRTFGFEVQSDSEPQTAAPAIEEK